MQVLGEFKQKPALHWLHCDELEQVKQLGIY